MSENTKKLLLMHCQTYPKLQIQDICKFLYQSAFGCEHLLDSEQGAIEGIFNEYHTIKPLRGSVEMLDGDFARVPLSYLGEGLSAVTLGKLFVSSATKQTDGKAELIQKIKIAKELAADSRLPFSSAEFSEVLSRWEREGYPAVRHSPEFRQAYEPSYRVIASRFVPFLPLFSALDRLLAKKTRVMVAIEGGSGSGKTTLGKLLESIYGCTLFHTDDFFLQPHQRTPERLAEVGGNMDRERFLSEVIMPWRQGETVCYRRFDCSDMELCPAVSVTPKKMTVVEGAYSMHPMFEKYYDLAVFLDICPKTQKERILKRNDPDTAQRHFTEWIPKEEQYFADMQIKKRCDLIITVA